MENIDWFVVVLVVVCLIILARIVYVTLWLTGHVDDTERYNKALKKQVQKKAKKFEKDRMKLVRKHTKQQERGKL